MGIKIKVLFCALVGLLGLVLWKMTWESPAPYNPTMADVEEKGRAADEVPLPTGNKPPPERTPLSTPVKIDQPDPESVVRASEHFKRLPRNRPLKVIVIAEETGKRVPGAQVAWYPYMLGSDPFTSQLANTYFQLRGSLLLKHGLQVIADARGEAEIPRCAKGWYLAARKANLLGFVASSKATADSLELKVNKQLYAQVVVENDQHHRLGGIPLLGISHCIDRFEKFYTGMTSKNGEARVNLTAQVTKEEPAILINAPFRPLVKTPITITQQSEQKTHLTLPPCGTLVVAVPTQVPGDEMTAHIRITGNAEPTRLASFINQWSAPVRKGRAVFPQVGLGLKFNLAVNTGPLSVSRKFGGIKEVVGPRVPGQICTFPIALQVKKNPGLKGRVVDPRGEGIADLLLCIECLQPGRVIDPEKIVAIVETDATGSFQIPNINFRPNPRATFPWSIQVTRWATSDQSGRPVGPQAKFDFNEPLPPGITDLGDFLLLEQNRVVMVSGLVTGRDGRPLANATISIWKFTREDMFFVAPSLKVTTNSQGQFKAFGQVDQKFELKVHKPGYFPKGVKNIAPGSPGIEVMLDKVVEVSGTISLEKGLHCHQLHAHCYKDGKLVGKQYINTKTCKFKLTKLSPGTYDIAIKLGQFNCKTISSIVLATDKPTVDPRLNPVDLRGILKPLNLRVTDKKGKPVTSIWASFLDNHGNPIKFTRDGGFGIVNKAVYLLPSGVTRITVGAIGYSTQDVEVVGKDVSVVLNQGISTYIKVMLPIKTTFMNRVIFDLVPVDNPLGPTIRKYIRWSAMSGMSRYGFSNLENIVIKVPGPGKYRVDWILLKGILDRAKETPITLARPMFLQIDQDAITPATLTLPKAAIDRAERRSNSKRN